MVAAADAKDRPALGQDVGSRKILGQAQRVPHRRDVKGAADLQVFGHMSEVHSKHQVVGDALVVFVLKMVLGEPQDLEAEIVHLLGNRLGLAKTEARCSFEYRRSLAGVAFCPRSGRSTCPA